MTSVTLSSSFTVKAGIFERRRLSGCSRSRVVTVLAKKAVRRERGPMGFVPEDNSGRANIFAVEPRTLYTSSPTSDRAARQGLGGQQGLLVVGGVIAVVALVTVGQGLNPAETLQGIAADASSESLTSVAARIAASL